jgi:hypothetical protein
MTLSIEISQVLYTNDSGLFSLVILMQWVSGDIKVATTVSIGIRVTKAIAKFVLVIVRAEDNEHVK